MIALGASSPLWLPVAFAAGLVVGLIHFRSLQQVSEDYLAGHAGRAVALQFLRLAVLAAVLVGLAWLGAGDLLAGTLGVLVARFFVLRRAGREP